MTILIPTDIADIDEAKITLLDDVKQWLLIKFDEGKIQNHTFYTNKDDIEDFIEVVIVKNQNEYVWPFMEEGIAVLVAPLQTYVEDVMEAFLFKELHDLNTGN